MACPYKLLGIAHGSNPAAARAAYVEKLKTAHPDRPGGSAALAKDLGEAHSLIKEGKASRRCDCGSAATARGPSFTPRPTRAPEAGDPFDFAADVDWETLVRQAARRAERAAAAERYAPRAYSSRDERTQAEDRKAEARQAARHEARARARAAASRFREANSWANPEPPPPDPEAPKTPRAGYYPPPEGYRPASAYQEPAPAPAYKAPPEPAKASTAPPSPETAEMFDRARKRGPRAPETSARERVEEFLRQRAGLK